VAHDERLAVQAGRRSRECSGRRHIARGRIDSAGGHRCGDKPEAARSLPAAASILRRRRPAACVPPAHGTRPQCPAVDAGAGADEGAGVCVLLLCAGGVMGCAAVCAGAGAAGLLAVADGAGGLQPPLLGLLLHPPTAKPIQATAIPSAVRFMIFS
jgi:hypothetical protein